MKQYNCLNISWLHEFIYEIAFLWSKDTITLYFSFWKENMYCFLLIFQYTFYFLLFQYT